MIKKIKRFFQILWNDRRDYISNVQGKLDDIFIHPFRVLKYGIQNFWYYKGVIWKDRDWDHHYFLVLLISKLKRMEKHLAKYSNHLRKDRDVLKVKIARIRLERFLNDNYEEPLWKEFREKWGDSKMESTPYSFDKFGRPSSYTIDFTYSKVKNQEEHLQAKKESKEILEKGEFLRKRDKEKAFRSISKWMEHWWW